MKKIENKAYLKEKEEKVIEEPQKEEKETKTASNDKIEVNFKRVGDSTMKKLHPKLAEHYEELNAAIFRQHTIGFRSRDLQRACEIDVEFIRAKIKEYKKNEGITREMEIKWMND